MYVTPINISCQKQNLPISYPSGYAKKLAAAIGDYSTLGLAEDANALNDQVIGEAAFLSGCDLIMQERERLFFHALEEFDAGILACVFDSPDRIQHMFWRYMDPNHSLYDEPGAQAFGQVIPDIIAAWTVSWGGPSTGWKRTPCFWSARTMVSPVFAGRSILTPGWWPTAS